MLDYDRPGDLEKWLKIWDNWPEKEIFCHPEYIKIFCQNYERPICFYWKGEEGYIFLPLIIRPLKAEEWLKGNRDYENFYDTVGPYGYGGPYYYGNIDEKEFLDSLFLTATSMRIVSCFMRLSIIKNQIIDLNGHVFNAGKNVIRPLEDSQQAIWMDYEHKVRKNIKRAESNGISIINDQSDDSINIFEPIYNSTLKRRNADGHYYFNRDFFKKFVNTFRSNIMFFHATYKGKMVSTELILISSNYIYSFLGGTLAEFFYLRPNDLLKHEIIMWGKRMGKKAFVLGGGYKGQEDGIFKYKKSFAPRNIVDFNIARIIFNEGAYHDLINIRKTYEKEKHPCSVLDENFFPVYRAPIKSESIC